MISRSDGKGHLTYGLRQAFGPARDAEGKKGDILLFKAYQALQTDR